MKDYIKIGIEKNLISFNEDMSRITYVFQNKERNYNNPEEKVQAETFLRLILDYNYPVKRIKQFVPVTMGRDVKEADIIVYEEDMCLRPHILVECKRQEISEAEYQQAIEQAYSYAYLESKMLLLISMCMKLSIYRKKQGNNVSLIWLLLISQN